MRKSNILFSKSQIRNVIKYFACFFIALSVLSILLYYKNDLLQQKDTNQSDNLMSNLFVPLKLKSINFEIDTTDSLTIQIRDIVSSSFNEYFQHCPNSDEFRPNDNQCLNQYGFSSTLFESLDVLFILGLKKEFQKAKNLIKKLQIQWVNRREFWSRCIGSLLSAYILTTDSFFLSKAIEFSKELLKSSLTAPFVNIENKKSREHQWIKGTSLTDVVAGLPELFTLSKLTNDESYSIAYLTILNNIPTFSDHSIFNFYDLESKRPNYDLNATDGNVIDFYHIQSIAFSIKPMKSLKEKLENFLDDIKLSNDEDCIYSRYSTLYDMISINKKNGIEIKNLNTEFEKLSSFLNNPETFFNSNCSSQIYVPFRFDASFLRAFVRNNNKQENKVLDLIKYSLYRCKLKKGFSGLMKINSDQNIHTNIQHSSFFGQWMSIASYLLSNQKDIVKNGVFNERGHLLYSSLIFSGEEDE